MSDRQKLIERWIEIHSKAPAAGGPRGTPSTIAATRPSPLVAIHTSAKRPLFFMHPIEGGVSSYRALGSHLAPSLSLYGLQQTGLEGECAVLAEIPAMAEEYAAAILEKQPSGGYLLGGFSFGGLIALEVAHRLVGRGFSVDLLAAVDTPLPAQVRRSHATDALSLYAKWARSVGVPFAEREIQIRAPAERVAYLYAQGQMSGAIPSTVQLQHFRHYWTVFESNVRAHERYVPPAYRGAIDLFVATEVADTHEPTSVDSWRTVTSGALRVHPLPGSHMTLLREPHVRVLAGQIAACVSRVNQTAAR